MSYSAAISPTFDRRRQPERSDLLIEENLPLVRKLAWHVHSRLSSAIEVEDLIQIGLIALIEASRGFEDRGFKFTTYASVRIRGAMIDHLRKESGQLRSASATRRAIDAARKSIQDRSGMTARDGDVAREMGIDLPAFIRLESSATPTREIPLDVAYADQDPAFEDHAPLADKILDDRRSEDELRDSIARLPEKEQLVLQLYFLEELNLDEIGAVLNVGAARVCQIKKAALSRLRASLVG